MRDDVWGRFYRDDTFELAVNMYAASLSAGATHETILNELERLSLWAMGWDDPKQNAERLAYLIAALVTIGWSSLETLAKAIEDSKAGGDDLGDPEEIRSTALDLLGVVSGNLRQQLS